MKHMRTGFTGRLGSEDRGLEEPGDRTGFTGWLGEQDWGLGEQDWGLEEQDWGLGEQDWVMEDPEDREHVLRHCSVLNCTSLHCTVLVYQ